MLKSGLVLRGIASFYYVLINKEVYECRASKKLKLNKKSILMGDDVIVDFEKKYILEIKVRKNVLIRPKVCNIDFGALVFSALEPKMSFQLLDRMIIPMELNSIRTIIIITKTDLVDLNTLKDLKAKLQYYEKIGYTVFFVNVVEDYEKLKNCIKKNRVVFTGQTGVGKSTLINKLSPKLNLETQKISKALGRGKHTTREVSFYPLGEGYIIDTPGFSSMEVPLTDVEIRDSYIDFVGISSGCKYNTCFHISEPNCKVKEALVGLKILESRYEGYKKLIETLRSKK